MPRTTLTLTFFALLATLSSVLMGCETEETETSTPCVVNLESVSPNAAMAGETATLTANPLTTVYDSAVYVGGSRATVMDVDRTACEACDSCRDDEQCGACGDCDNCDATCTECVETLTFKVPDTETGVTTLQLFNAYGNTNTLEFEVLSSDTGTLPSDTGTNDTGLNPGKKPTP